jgi:hypothetical protein
VEVESEKEELFTFFQQVLTGAGVDIFDFFL